MEDEIALLQVRTNELLRQLGDADAARSQVIWAEIRDTICVQIRTVLLEHRRALDLGVLVDVEEVLSSYRNLLDNVKLAIEEQIRDRRLSAHLVQAIADRMNLLAPGPHNTIIDNNAAE